MGRKQQPAAPSAKPSELKEVSPECPLEDPEEQAHLKAVASSFFNYEAFSCPNPLS